ncbi:MAG TPA: ribbon-helix-helix protein, CopG family [Nitrospirae bacterium]|nr:ribbon-helix-helix protein, CopG family [Nitrospirota bacterium]
MGKTKIAITLDGKYIQELDHLVNARYYQNRSQAIQEAVKEKLQKIKQVRLSRECLKLQPSLEKAMAEDGISEDMKEWPEY